MFQTSEDFSAEMRRISEDIYRFENEDTLHPEETDSFADVFENEETVILEEADSYTDSFENEETVILEETDSYTGDFEDEETASPEEPEGCIDGFENEETVIISDDAVQLYHQDVQVPPAREVPPAAPAFDYRTVYKEYRTGDAETAYIDHLRRLKGLLDDGIITEDEFTRKKQQILGL